ncbi:Calcium and integrin-binding family member 2 [Oopsacas minuta]|uniref:Calcium and integrin-binding family member 2 n=1 Tax=Oopsacas minuta TaxID=111878 RepID=A0AAV7KHZ9_9METZ|nr:Calcium and integrin-binding family member 2 [Oopsacas minuta]
MVSVLSHNARKDDKILCAFKVYDFDGDDFIGRRDLEKLLDKLCGYNSDLEQQPDLQVVDVTEIQDVETPPITASGEGRQAQPGDGLKANRLSDEEKRVIIDKIFEESLMSNEEKLCLDDFAHIISKSPDFFKTFRVRI